MKDFCMPDYKGGSIVNLMSSISHSFKAKSLYKELRILPGNEIKSKNVVLLIIDGLGYEYLTKNHSESLLNAHLLGSVTSVFPPTTSSAVTTFLTGVAPQQHAFTGWWVNLKEVGAVSIPLRFCTKKGKQSLSKYGLDITSILNQRAFTTKINAKNFVIQDRTIVNSDFSKEMSKNAKSLGYDTLEGMFKKIKKAIKSKGKRKYIYAYWSQLDHIAHEKGINHKKADKHIKEIDKKLAKFIKTIKGTDTTLIVTADHGHMESPLKRNIFLADHLKLKACLSTQLCGEKRTAYCYVHPSKAKQFENYVKNNLSKYFYLFKSQELIDKNFFGLFKENPKLFDRIGDYTLIAKENYLISDDKDKKDIGQHAGISKEEMLVPLIIITC